MMSCGLARLESAVRATLVASVLVALASVNAGAAEPAREGDSLSGHVHRARAHAGLDDRVQLLSKALELDAGQQAALKKVLEAQREQVSRLWANESLPAAYRVSATQAIGEKTADQIRALLNDEQKKRFNPPKPPHEAAASSSLSVEDWMSKTRPN
jgi:Spy/CpxP family protein refolding chaperone